MKEMFGGLPKWAQGVIAVAVVGGVGFLGYKAYKKIQESKSLKDSDQTAKDARKELDKLLDNGQNLTHPKMVYQTASNSIVNSLDGCDSSENEYDVVDTIKSTIKKPIDWYYLVQLFGSKLIDNCLWGAGETPYALPELLKDQLGQFTRWNPTKTNYEDVKEYLKKIGITI